MNNEETDLWISYEQEKARLREMNLSYEEYYKRIREAVDKLEL